jgi:hypothetical protein
MRYRTVEVSKGGGGMSIVENMKNPTGISCVEIYLLAWLKERGIDCRSLYADSFAEIADVINDFLTGEYGYLNYAKLPRVQETAQRLGGIRLCYKNALQKEENRLNAGETPFVRMLGVKPDYKSGKLTPWRDDHFLLQYDGKYYDCYPPGEFTPSRGDIFDGRVLEICLSGSFPPYGNELQRLKERVLQAELRDCVVNVTADNIMRIRDGVMILKISRQRMSEVFPENDPLKEQVKRLGTFCALLEAFRNRGRIGECKDIWCGINLLEKEWRKCV